MEAIVGGHHGAPFDVLGMHLLNEAEARALVIPTGYFAPTSRYGSPDDFRHFVDKAHQAGLGIIMDISGTMAV